MGEFFNIFSLPLFNFTVGKGMLFYPSIECKCWLLYNILFQLLFEPCLPVQLGFLVKQEIGVSFCVSYFCGISLFNTGSNCKWERCTINAGGKIQISIHYH